MRIESSTISRSMCFPGAVVIPLAKKNEENEEKERLIEEAMRQATSQGEDQDMIWTDESRLGNGRVGVGVAWYEVVKEEEGKIDVDRRAVYGLGGIGGTGRTIETGRKRREHTYQEIPQSLRRAQSGWRTHGFSMGGGHEAYDAELTAIISGLIHLLGMGETGRSDTTFTDSTAAMKRASNDIPGPGQEIAIQIIELERRLTDHGNSITLRWTPAYRVIEGNERAEAEAREMATLPPLRATDKRLVWPSFAEGPPREPLGGGGRISTNETPADRLSDYLPRQQGQVSGRR